MSIDERTPETVVNSVAPVLPVRDVATALERFRAMGFLAEAYRHDDDSPPFYGFVCMGPTEFHVARVDDLSCEANTSALYLYVDDADEIHERWRDLEGKVTVPEDTPYGLREFGYVDPDGNLFRVGSPLEQRE